MASSRVMPSLAVTRPSEVMHSLIFLAEICLKLQVTVGDDTHQLAVPSVIGTPEMRNLAIRSLASFSVCSGERKTDP